MPDDCSHVPESEVDAMTSNRLTKEAETPAAGVASKGMVLQLFAAIPWLMLLIAGLFWVLTLDREIRVIGRVNLHGAILIPQPVVLAMAMAVAAAIVATANIVAATLSLLWQRTRSGWAALASGLMFNVGVYVVWVCIGPR